MVGPRRRERCPIFFFLRDSANLSGFFFFFFPAAAGDDAVRFKPSESTKRLGGSASRPGGALGRDTTESRIMEFFHPITC